MTMSHKISKEWECWGGGVWGSISEVRKTAHYALKLQSFKLIVQTIPFDFDNTIDINAFGQHVTPQTLFFFHFDETVSIFL